MSKVYKIDEQFVNVISQVFEALTASNLPIPANMTKAILQMQIDLKRLPVDNKESEFSSIIDPSIVGNTEAEGIGHDPRG